MWHNDSHAPFGCYGAKVQAFGLELQKRGVDDVVGLGQRRDMPISDEEALWENFFYFIVLPVAEESA